MRGEKVVACTLPQWVCRSGSGGRRGYGLSDLQQVDALAFKSCTNVFRPDNTHRERFPALSEWRARERKSTKGLLYKANVI
jgi:hypothetical protein